MIAIWPAGPPKLMKPSLSQKPSASAKEITPLGERAAAGAAGAGGAAEAVARRDDRARRELVRIEIADVRRSAVRRARIELEHLVEVAVVERPSQPTESVLRHISPGTVAGLKAFTSSSM